jgi:hypothetical protein
MLIVCLNEQKAMRAGFTAGRDRLFNDQHRVSLEPSNWKGS